MVQNRPIIAQTVTYKLTLRLNFVKITAGYGYYSKCISTVYLIVSSLTN